MKSTPRSHAPEQLALLDERGPSAVPSQFRLSHDTRRLGMRQVALMRQRLLDQAARQRAGTLPARPVPTVTVHRDAA